MTLNYLYVSPDNGKQPKQLLIFLHGYGSNAFDFLDLAKQFRPLFSEMGFILPNAPEILEGMADAYSWFSIDGLVGDAIGMEQKIAVAQKGVTHAAPALETFISTIADIYQCSKQQLILFGFSQGAMLASDAALRQTYLGAIACAGMLPFADQFAQHYSASTPLLLCHGKQDEVVPSLGSEYAYEILTAQNHPAELYLSDHAAHHLDHGMLTKILDFLHKRIIKA